MPADQRSTLFLPNKHRFVTAGEDGQDVDYGANWRALELWSRVKWQKMNTATTPLLNGWSIYSDVLPQYCIDGFGFVHFRGQLQHSAWADPNFWQLPETIRPPQAEELAVSVAVNFVYGPGLINLFSDGNIYLGGTVAAGANVIITLSGSFSTVPLIT